MGGAAVRENQSDIAALQAGLKARKPARDGLRLYTAPPTFESVSLCGFYRGRSAFLMLSGPSLKQIDLSLLEKHQAAGLPTLADLTRDLRPLIGQMLDLAAEPANATVWDRLWTGAKSIVRG